MSHSGPSYAEIVEANRRRKELQPTTEQIVEAVLTAIRTTAQETYEYRGRGTFVTVSPSSHAELLREAIEERVKSALYSVNAYEYPKEVTP